ncbi:MAG TPA: threonine synthase, partial [Cytophagales bacterium]|nr:threonine synthase [Cytophagales bacterium]
MKFYSTRSPENLVSFREAVLQGLAPDGGLYVPTEIPALPNSFWAQWKDLSAEELAVQVLAPFVKEDIPESELAELVKPVVSFPFPLVHVRGQVHSLELFHGPTLAFKDVGATFLAQTLGYFARQQAQEYTVLVATSGGTGGAVANGFFGVEGTRVIILYPSGGVSPSQEKQLTTYGGNITALEVDGTFDDCQALVKKAFLDAELKSDLSLTSANSINLARLLPQSLYYFLG